jgi:hypothetical protein
MYKNGYEKTPRCDSDWDDDVCAGYRAGYEAGWLASIPLWSEQRQEALGR